MITPEVHSAIKYWKSQIQLKKNQLVGLTDKTQRAKIEMEIGAFEYEIKEEQRIAKEDLRDLDGTGLDELMRID